MGQPSKEAKQRYFEKNRDKIAARKRQHYLENKTKYLTLERDRQYRKRYGITLADYDRMLAEQGGKCLICEATDAGKVGQCFAVDHCHATGRVRGLLCIKCNSRLGWFEANEARVVAYLKK
jgi:Recombination endonuclease VII